MRYSPLLGFSTALLSGTVVSGAAIDSQARVGIIANDEAALPTWNCTVAGWVRAPDLRPNSILPADARLYANGTDCTDIQRWDVGLRFRERAVVKLRAAEVDLPMRPKYNETEEAAYWANRRMSHQHDSVFDAFSPWEDITFGQSPYELAEKAYYQALANRSLWEAHAAERVAFDSRQTLLALDKDAFLPMHSVESFTIAVPNVNLPPSLRYESHRMWSDEDESAEHESRFEFYFDLILRNGSTVAVPAANAAFVPTMHSVQQPKASNVTFSLTSYTKPYGEQEDEIDQTCPIDNSTTFEISLSIPGDGGVLQQGTTTFIPVTVWRTNGTQIPKAISLSARTTRDHKFAASFAHSDAQAQKLARSGYREMEYSPQGLDEMHRSEPVGTTLEEEAEKMRRVQVVPSSAVRRRPTTSTEGRKGARGASDVSSSPAMREVTVIRACNSQW